MHPPTHATAYARAYTYKHTHKQCPLGGGRVATSERKRALVPSGPYVGAVSGTQRLAGAFVPVPVGCVLTLARGGETA